MRQMATTAVLLGSLLAGTAQAQQPAPPAEPDRMSRQYRIDQDKFDYDEVCTFEAFVTFYNLPILKPDFYLDTVHFRYLHDETHRDDQGADEIWKIYSYADNGVSSDSVVMVPHSYVGDVLTKTPTGYFNNWRITANRLPPGWRTKTDLVRQFSIGEIKAAGDEVDLWCEVNFTFQFNGEALLDVEMDIPNYD